MLPGSERDVEGGRRRQERSVGEALGGATNLHSYCVWFLRNRR